MATESATSTMSYEDSLSSQYLTSSISSLSSARAQTSRIARTYRQAAQLFLTRRLYEALSTIEPLLSPSENGDLGLSGHDHEYADGQGVAPVAAASRATRVKVWSFYLTLLNSIIELGPDEGKLVFGSVRWRALAAKAREGSIWDEVVRIGYGDDSGAVDGEVVINLATLLLTHMPSQKLNQHKLETYLSALSNPTYDVAAHMQSSQAGIRSQSPSKHSGGTSTPRDLNTRLKLLELYTLHILPHNAEWAYARDFINMSEVLDEERREAFLHALQMLNEEKEHDAIRERELRRRQEEEIQQRHDEEEKRRKDRLKQQEEEKRRRETEDKQRASISKTNLPSRDRGTSASSSTRAQSDGGSQAKKTPPSKGRAPSKRPPVSSPPGVYHRATSLLFLMQSRILNIQHSIIKNPMALFRLLLFLLAFSLAFGRRDVRERIKRIMNDSWDKVRRTIGMGVKVSYI